MRNIKKTPEQLVEHFQKRCQERIGYILTQKFLKQERLNHKLELLEKQSNNRFLYRLRRKYSEDYVVVFDKLRNTFVTIMYYERWKENKQSLIKELEIM